MTQIAINFPNWWGWMFFGMMTVDAFLTALSCILHIHLTRLKVKQARESVNE